jgi:hypothetical protein
MQLWVSRRKQDFLDVLTRRKDAPEEHCWTDLMVGWEIVSLPGLGEVDAVERDVAGSTGWRMEQFCPGWRRARRDVAVGVGPGGGPVRAGP